MFWWERFLEQCTDVFWHYAKLNKYNWGVQESPAHVNVRLNQAAVVWTKVRHVSSLLSVNYAQCHQKTPWQPTPPIKQSCLAKLTQMTTRGQTIYNFLYSGLIFFKILLQTHRHLKPFFFWLALIAKGTPDSRCQRFKWNGFYQSWWNQSVGVHLMLGWWAESANYHLIKIILLHHCWRFPAVEQESWTFILLAMLCLGWVLY